MNKNRNTFMEYLLSKKEVAAEEVNDFVRIIEKGYASPMLYGAPELVDMTPAMAKRILRLTRLWPRQRRENQMKLREFADLMRQGKWVVDLKQPVMISKSSVLINGRHRLRAIIRAGVSAMIPLIDLCGIVSDGLTDEKQMTNGGL